MFVDGYFTLVREQTGPPGCYGDSCNETSRAVVVHRFLKHWSEEILDLEKFVTENGYVRHPESPWREDDMPTDQMLPLFLAAKKTGNKELTGLIINDIKKNKFRTPNGQLVHPIFLAFLTDNKLGIELCLAAQAAFFKIPWRWNDQKKQIESSSNESSDYVNWLVYALDSTWAYKLIPKETLKKKVWEYYKPEPNSQWLIEIYEKAINLKWS